MKKTKCLLAAILLSLVCLLPGCSNSSGSNGSGGSLTNDDDKTTTGEIPEDTPKNPVETPENTDPKPSHRTEVSGKNGRYGKPYQVGDIIFKDGSAEEYSSELELTDEQKSAAIALIFYKSGIYEKVFDTKRTLGVGLVHSGTGEDGLMWCTASDNKADAHDLEITTIICEAQKNSITGFTYTGDTNGSDNLEQIEAFEGVNDTSDPSKYPAFYFAKNYKNQIIAGETESRVAGTEFEDGWYLPSLAELCEICWCMEKKIFDIDAASVLCGGDKFGSDSYVSASQKKVTTKNGRVSGQDKAYGVNFSTKYVIGNDKINDAKIACAIREFD